MTEWDEPIDDDEEEAGWELLETCGAEEGERVWLWFDRGPQASGQELDLPVAEWGLFLLDATDWNGWHFRLAEVEPFVVMEGQTLLVRELPGPPHWWSHGKQVQERSDGGALWVKKLALMGMRPEDLPPPIPPPQ